MQAMQVSGASFDFFLSYYCYALGERPARLELDGYDFVVWHVVFEACASDTQ